MTGPEIQDTYFSPFMFFIYMVIVFVGMIIYYQWVWNKKSTAFIKVLIVKPDGTTDTEYAPKQGGYVALKVANSDTTRLWPISKLSAIEMLYPGDGFIPVFLQKKIKTVIVDAEDWEPLLNRGSYSKRVASPDVVDYLRDLAEQHPNVSAQLTDLADSLSTAPTRDMVASPSVLGNLLSEKISEMAISLSKDSFDKLEGVIKRLDKLPNAIVIYIGLGAILVMGIITIAVLAANTGGIKDVKELSDGINAIQQALGITSPVAPVP